MGQKFEYKIYRRFKVTESNPAQREIKGKIGNSNVTVMLGDMMQMEADAYVVPQLPDGREEGSLHYMLSHTPMEEGLAKYQQHAQRTDMQPEDVFSTPVEGGKAGHLLDVPCKFFSREAEYSDVHRAFYYALIEADRLGPY